MLQLFPACFSCCNNFNISQSPLGLEDKIFLEFLEAMIAGELSSNIRNSSLILDHPFCLISNFFSFPNS